MALGSSKYDLIFSKNVWKKNQHNNVVFSPLSVSMAMGMVAIGARGPTLSQILGSCFNIDADDDKSDPYETVFHLLNEVFGDGESPLKFSNSVTVDKSVTLKPLVKYILRSKYKCDIRYEDLNIMSKPEEDEIKLVIKNVLDFKERWDEPFGSYQTRKKRFHLLNGEKVKVDMMKAGGRKKLKTLSDCKILSLPFQKTNDQNFVMYIVLPNEKNGLPNLEENIDLSTFHSPGGRIVWLQEFWLPKFKMGTEIHAEEILQQMGVTFAFRYPLADFKEMVEEEDGKDLYIERVEHKACIQVNERGTEASAETRLKLSGGGTWDGEIENFVADHPFLFFIKEKTSGAIIFVGHVLDPSKTD